MQHDILRFFLGGIANYMSHVFSYENLMSKDEFGDTDYWGCFIFILVATVICNFVPFAFVYSVLCITGVILK